MKRMSWSTVLTVFALLAATCTGIRAQGLVTASPDLPADGIYVSPLGQSMEYPPLGIVVNFPVLDPDVDTTIRTTIGNDEQAIFNAVLSGVEIGLGAGPVALTGPVDMLTTGRMLSTTGLFDTEIVSMSLSGITLLGPVMLRESPMLPSVGRTDITDLGGGLYHIDSFFDVFTELSVDGGQSWTPSTEAIRLNLIPIPEPSTLALLGLAIGLLLRRKR